MLLLKFIFDIALRYEYTLLVTYTAGDTSMHILILLSSKISL